ncbi:MAG: hypothetical protein ACLFV2_06705 [Desulfurivibrionaceae bacterium]
MPKKVISPLAIVGAPLLMSFILISPGKSLAEKPEAEISTGLYSQYIWRGYEFSQDSLVIQPSLTVAYKGFGFNLWGNLDTDENGRETSNWNETDITVSYDGSAGMVGYSLGYIYYALEDGAEDSQEVYAGITLDTLLSPSLTVYRDFDAFPGYYVTLGISHSLALNHMMSLDLGARAGYYDLDNGGYDAFHDGRLSVALPVVVSDYVTFSPELYYSFPLSSEASDELEAASIDGDDDSFLYGGVAVSFAF